MMSTARIVQVSVGGSEVAVKQGLSCVRIAQNALESPGAVKASFVEEWGNLIAQSGWITEAESRGTAPIVSEDAKSKNSPLKAFQSPLEALINASVGKLGVREKTRLKA